MKNNKKRQENVWKKICKTNMYQVNSNKKCDNQQNKVQAAIQYLLLLPRDARLSRARVAK